MSGLQQGLLLPSYLKNTKMQKKPLKQTKINTFCSRPWNDVFLANKGFSPCCMIKENNFDSLQDYLTSDYLKEIKHSLLTGHKHPACKVCWDQEDAKVWSNRVQADVDFKNPKIKYAGIDFSNTCNLACQMCQPYLSTSLGKRLNKRDGTKIQVWNTLSTATKKLEFYKDLLPSLELLSMSGGEPFQSPDHLEFLKVAPQINSNLSLFYNSNVSNLYFKGEYIPKYFKRFKNVSISPSIDGFGLANDYQRLNSNWDKLVKNMLEIKNYIDYIHATPTIYTLFSLGDLFDWGIKNDINVEIYMISQGPLHPSILPKDIKVNYVKQMFIRFKKYPRIIKQFESAFFKSILKENSNNEELVKQFKRQTIINNQDSHINFPDFAPELKEWYDSILL